MDFSSASEEDLVDRLLLLLPLRRCLTACRPTKIPRIRTSGTPTPSPTPSPTLRVRGLVSVEELPFSVESAVVGELREVAAPAGDEAVVVLEGGVAVEALVVFDEDGAVVSVEDDSVVGAEKKIGAAGALVVAAVVVGGVFPELAAAELMLK
jgi:hypothetical protein